MGQLLAHLTPFTGYPYVGAPAACNLCGSEETLLICDRDRRWKKLRTVACADCGLMRTDPMPTERELEEYYQSNYRLDYQLASNRPPRFHLVRSRREAARRISMLSDCLRPGMRVLDVGCGTGEFLKAARDRGCDVVGIEPGEAYASFAGAEYGLDIINASWRDAPLEPASFDVVTCHQVIEHLREPVEAMRAIANWVKPDGIVYLSVPDMRANEKPGFDRFHFAHVYGFTPETMEAAAHACGLAPASGGRLDATTALFAKADPDASAVALTDPARAVALRVAYPHVTFLQHVLQGGYFMNFWRRFRKWLRDGVALRPVRRG